MLPVLPVGATSSRPGGVAAFASSRSAGPSSTSETDSPAEALSPPSTDDDENDGDDDDDAIAMALHDAIADGAFPGAAVAYGRVLSGGDLPSTSTSSSRFASEQAGGSVVAVLENVVDPRNYEYILRTVKALGVSDLWVIAGDSFLSKVESGLNRYDRGAVDHAALEREIGCLRRFRSPQEFLDYARGLSDRLEVWATDLSQAAVTVDEAVTHWRSLGASRPTLAVVFGTESEGVSQMILEAAARRVYFPIHGFLDSFNVSASVAIILDAILQSRERGVETRSTRSGCAAIRKERRRGS